MLDVPFLLNTVMEEVKKILVAWIMSILRSFVGNFAGLLFLLKLASLAMNRLLYSIISLLPYSRGAQ